MRDWQSGMRGPFGINGAWPSEPRTAIDVHLLGGIARARRRRLAVPMLCLSCAELVAHLGQTALLYRRHVEVEGLARPGQQTTAQSMRSTYGAACNQSRRSCSGLAAACAKLFVADGSIGKQATRAGRIAEASRGSQEMLTVRSYARRLGHHRAACKVHALRAQCARLRALGWKGGGTRDTLITSPCTVALDSHVKVARVLCSPCGCVVCSVLLCVVCGGQCEAVTDDHGDGASCAAAASDAHATEACRLRLRASIGASQRVPAGGLSLPHHGPRTHRWCWKRHGRRAPL